MGRAGDHWGCYSEPPAQRFTCWIRTVSLFFSSHHTRTPSVVIFSHAHPVVISVWYVCMHRFLAMGLTHPTTSSTLFYYYYFGATLAFRRRFIQFNSSSPREFRQHSVAPSISTSSYFIYILYEYFTHHVSRVCTRFVVNYYLFLPANYMIQWIV